LNDAEEENLQGWVAMCSRGYPGLILGNTRQSVTYPDGNTGTAWTGIHLDPDIFGQPWSSRNPKLMYRAYSPTRAAERF